jgi:hypothetical protein
MSINILEKHSASIFMLQCQPSIENSGIDIMNEGTGPQFEISKPVIGMQQGKDFIIRTKERLCCSLQCMMN